MKNRQYALLVLGLWSPVVAFAQSGSGDTQQAVSDFLISPEALKAITEAGEAGGKDIRWLTLAEKRAKVARTNELTESKRKQNELQREELGKVAHSLTRTFNLFEAYYEKYQLVTGAVRTLVEAREFTRRVAAFVEAIRFVYRESRQLALLEPQELRLIESYLEGMVGKAEHIVEKGDILLLDKSSQSAEMDRLQEEHGEFFVLMRAVDRTEQLNALNADIAGLSGDLQRLAAYIASTINQRSYGTRNTEALSRLFDRL